MAKYINIPFAESGNKTAIPDTTTDGTVNYTDGFGGDYARPLGTDPLAKTVDRDTINQALYDYGTAIKQLQENGVFTWQSTKSGGYDVGATVLYNGINYTNTVSGNTAIPGATGSGWNREVSTVATVADMIAIVAPSDNDVCIVTDNNQGGTFVYDSTQSTVNNGGTIFNGWVRQYSGAVNIRWFGAKGDGVTDDTGLLQYVINNFNNIFISNGTYIISKPLQIPSVDEHTYFTMKGETNTVISKVTDTVGTGSTVWGNSTISYAVDYIIIIENVSNTTSYDVTIKNILLNSNGGTSSGGIFTSTVSRLNLSNVTIMNTAETGFYTNDCWMSVFENLHIRGKSRDTGNGIFFDSSVKGYTGTSCHFSNVWVTDKTNGYFIEGLSYSSFDNCGADHIGHTKNGGISYGFYTARGVSLNGCGTEDVLNNNSSIIDGSGSMSISGLRVENVTALSTNASMIRWGTGELFCSGLDICDWATSTKGYALPLANSGASVYYSGVLRTTGNTFTGAGISVSLSNISLSYKSVFITDESSVKSSGTLLFETIPAGKTLHLRKLYSLCSKNNGTNIVNSDFKVKKTVDNSVIYDGYGIHQNTDVDIPNTSTSDIIFYIVWNDGGAGTGYLNIKSFDWYID